MKPYGNSGKWILKDAMNKEQFRKTTVQIPSTGKSQSFWFKNSKKLNTVQN